MGFFKEGAGFLFQNFALVENKPMRQNMELICKKAEATAARRRHYALWDFRTK